MKRQKFLGITPLRRLLTVLLPMPLLFVGTAAPGRADLSPDAAVAKAVQLADSVTACANGGDSFCVATRDLALAMEQYAAFCVGDTLNALGVGQTAAATWPTSLGCGTRTTQAVQIVSLVEDIALTCDLTSTTEVCQPLDDLILLSASLIEGCSRETVNAADVGLSIPGDDNLACGPLASATLSAIAAAQVSVDECNSGRSGVCATLVADANEALAAVEGCVDGVLGTAQTGPVTGAPDPGCAAPVATAVAAVGSLSTLVSECANGTNQTCTAIVAAVGSAASLVVSSLNDCLSGSNQACASAQGAANDLAALVTACANAPSACVGVPAALPTEVAEDTPSPCVPIPVVSVTFRSPTGVDSTLPSPGFATVTNFRDADGTEFSAVTPPPGFSPLTGSDAALDAFDFPERPAPGSDEYESYQAAWSSYVAPTPPQPCTVADGPVHAWSNENYAGYDISASSAVRRISAGFKVPTFQAKCPHASSVSSWVSLGQDPLVQAGVATFNELQNSKVFFEAVKTGPNGDYTKADYYNEIPVAAGNIIHIWMRYRSDLNPIRYTVSVLNGTTGHNTAYEYRTIGTHPASFWFTDPNKAWVVTERDLKADLVHFNNLRYFGRYEFSDVFVKRATDSDSRPLGLMPKNEVFALDSDSGHETHDVAVPVSGTTGKSFQTGWLGCS
jgi:hypothetical protein